MPLHFTKRMFRSLSVKVCDYTDDVVITLKSPFCILAPVFSTTPGTGAQ